MAKKKSIAPHVVPTRLSSLISENNLEHAQLARLIIEYGTASKTTEKSLVSSISYWITGKRPVPAKYVDALAEIFHVTKEYLFGISDEPNSTTPSKKPKTTHQTAEIAINDLVHYDNCPVYVSFLTESSENAWGICDISNNHIVFKGSHLELTEYNKKHIRVYVLKPEHLDTIPQCRKQIPLAEAMKLERVYIRMRTDDIKICSLYNGWYRNNESKTGFISATGHILPYEGTGFTYNIYPDVPQCGF